MKLLMESWRGYLNEICDPETLLPPYDFEWDEAFHKSKKRSKGEEHYTFTTDGGSKYDVIFTQQSNPLRPSDSYRTNKMPWEIEFEIDGMMYQTMENEPLKIMSTIIAIIKDFIDDSDLNRGILKFVFTGGASIDKGKETQRTKLYKKCLELNLPDNFKIRQPGPNVIFFGEKDEDDKK